MLIEKIIENFAQEIEKKEDLASLAELRKDIMGTKGMRKPDLAYLSELCFAKKYGLVDERYGKQAAMISKA